MFMPVCLSVCLPACIYVSMYPCLSVSIYACMHACMHTQGMCHRGHPLPAHPNVYTHTSTHKATGPFQLACSRSPAVAASVSRTTHVHLHTNIHQYTHTHAHTTHTHTHRTLEISCSRSSAVSSISCKSASCPAENPLSSKPSRSLFSPLVPAAGRYRDLASFSRNFSRYFFWNFGKCGPYVRIPPDLLHCSHPCSPSKTP